MRRPNWTLVLVAGVLFFSAATPASSALIPRQQMPVGDVDYFTTDSGDAGLVVTDAGIELDNTRTGRGLATSAQYWFGDRDDPTNVYAFTFTHRLEGHPWLTIRFDASNVAFDEVDNVAFSVFEEEGGFVGRVTEESVEMSFRAGPPDTTYYVIVMIDTHELRPGEHIRGVFSVSARDTA